MYTQEQLKELEDNQKIFMFQYVALIQLLKHQKETIKDDVLRKAYFITIKQTIEKDLGVLCQAIY